MLHPHDIFEINKNNIKCKVPCSIYIDKKEYDERTFVETSKKLSLPGILQFYVPKYEDYTQIILTYSVDVYKTTDIEYDKNSIIIKYTEGDLVISKKYVPVDVDIGLLIRLLQGRVKYVKDPKILLNMLHDILPNVDLIHLELIISNMFRDEKNLDNRCRLTGKYNNSVILGQQKQPFQDSWESSIAFQYIDRAITTGLITGKDSQRNPIEKVLSEDFKGL